MLSQLRARTRASWTRRRGGEPVLRCAPGELVDVTLTLNGQPASVRVAPRVTLADALRDHLGLTGTHLGCEHGVCGMCTVLVDGDAARACLILACQVDGGDVVTVEGMGTPQDLHPIQQSFGAHHALQCGFCTPGQIMSAYDLLRSTPNPDEAELPEQLSGVLCRCTGYRNIIAAVAGVAGEYPDGVPGPGNCQGDGIRLPRASLGGPGRPTDLEPVSSGRTEITVPTGRPTAVIEVETSAAETVDRIWSVIEDTRTLAACLPGAEIIDDFGSDLYKGRMRVGLGPVRLAFVGDVRILEREQENHRVKVVGQAADAASGDVAAVVELSLEPGGSAGTRLRAVAELHMVGRIAQFGRGLVNDVSRDMFSQFASNIEAAARGETPSHAGPANALTMAQTLIRSRLKALKRLLSKRSN